MYSVRTLAKAEQAAALEAKRESWSISGLIATISAGPDVSRSTVRAELSVSSG
jgi:hypothetical protein